MSKQSFRSVNQAVFAREQSEGVGARVKRSIGTSELRNFDPFLMLDRFNLQVPAGFPKHPHRGFETVTYLLPNSGNLLHADFMGNKGKIEASGVQWMTAGRGIMHSEMPDPTNTKSINGLQLWVNLPGKDKMSAPAYQEIHQKDMPVAEKDGIKAVVIAGEALGVKAHIFTHTPIHYIHFTMQPNTELDHPLDANWNAFLFTLDGNGYIGGDESKLYQKDHTVVLKRDGENVKIKAGKDGIDFVLVAGQPIGEPIVQHGPFVMQNYGEIQKTFMDYQRGTNGFEGAHTWKCPLSGL